MGTPKIHKTIFYNDSNHTRSMWRVRSSNLVWDYESLFLAIKHWSQIVLKIKPGNIWEA